MMIKGKRIFLRRFQVEDASILLKWGENPRYHKMAGFEKIENLGQAKKSAKLYAERNLSDLICLNDTKEPIGLIELYERGMDANSGLLKTKELGFLLDESFEGHGYMTEALTLLINYTFKELGQLEIWAGTFEDNLKSQKLLKKLGFNYMYDVDYAMISDIFTYQEKYYLLKKADWLKINETTKS